jgi:hypothetical protein
MRCSAKQDTAAMLRAALSLAPLTTRSINDVTFRINAAVDMMITETVASAARTSMGVTQNDITDF